MIIVLEFFLITPNVFKFIYKSGLRIIFINSKFVALYRRTSYNRHRRRSLFYVKVFKMHITESFATPT